VSVAAGVDEIMGMFTEATSEPTPRRLFPVLEIGSRPPQSYVL
jgi:hypothetical protein